VQRRGNQMVQVSTSAATAPAYLTGWAAGRRVMDFLRDPLMAMRSMYESHGDLVYLQDPIPFLKSAMPGFSPLARASIARS